MYPYAGDKYEMRTSEATRQHALLAEHSGTDVSTMNLPQKNCRPLTNGKYTVSRR